MQLCNTYLGGYSARPIRQFNTILIWTKTKEEIWVFLFLLLFLRPRTVPRAVAQSTYLASVPPKGQSHSEERRGGCGYVTLLAKSLDLQMQISIPFAIWNEGFFSVYSKEQTEN